PDFQCDVNRRVAVHLQNNTRLHIPAEAVPVDFERVRSDGQIREHIGAIVAGDYGTDQASGGLRNLHLSAGNGKAARIANHAVDLRRSCGLAPHEGAGEPETENDFPPCIHPPLRVSHSWIFETSEDELQCELNDARGARRQSACSADIAEDLTEVAGVSGYRARSRPGNRRIQMIRKIEGFASKLNPGSLGYREHSHYRYIELENSRTSHIEETQIAVGAGSGGGEGLS